MERSDGDPLEELARLPSFHHPGASPDGSKVAYYDDATGRNELYVHDLGGEARRVSDGEVPRDATWPFAWAPDGEAVYFHRDDAGDEQNDIYRLSLDGDVEPVVEMEGQVVLHDVAGDGRLLVSSNTGEQMNLYEYDPATGETTRLTAYRLAVWSGRYAPGGGRVAYNANETDDLDNRDVYVADLGAATPPLAEGDADDAGSGVRRLDVGDVGAETRAVDWSPDGTELLIADDTTDTDRPGIYDLETGTVEWFDSEYVEEPVVVLPDGERFVTHRTRRAAVVPVVYDRDGTGRELDLPEGVAGVPSSNTYMTYPPEAVVDADTLVVTHETTDERATLSTYDLATGATETLVEPAYGDFDPDEFVAADFHTFESVDGLEIEALVYDSGVRPSPAVVKVHGGPTGQDQFAFDRYAQLFCGMGYSVLEVNYRGSTGRGREFKDRLKGDWGGAEQADIAAGTRWLADRGWVDGDRVAVFGGSYGGYSAYCQLLQYPELYACGVSWVGISDLHAFYEEAMPQFRTELMEKYMGDPDENHDLWVERSPTAMAENLSAPLLIVHGVNDRRVPVSQARLMRERLTEAGFEESETGEFEYRELGAEGHGTTDISQQIRAFEIVGDFFERRLGRPTAPDGE